VRHFIQPIASVYEAIIADIRFIGKPHSVILNAVKDLLLNLTSLGTIQSWSFAATGVLKLELGNEGQGRRKIDQGLRPWTPKG
jgi:hypothetical protein